MADQINTRAECEWLRRMNLRWAIIKAMMDAPYDRASDFDELRDRLRAALEDDEAIDRPTEKEATND